MNHLAIRHVRAIRRRPGLRPLLAFVLSVVLIAAAGVAGAPASLADPPSAGDSIYVGQQYFISGSAMTFPVYLTKPADPDNPGEPDFWAYCVEQQEHAHSNVKATVGELDSFIGDNYFTDPAVQGKVLWVLAHGYPALGLSDFATAVGIPGLTRDEAISGMTTAIWRYTDVDFDASYYWIDDNAEAVYWYLVHGANASSGLTAGYFDATVSITPPAGPQTAGTLVGPFVVHTNKPTAAVSVDPDLTLTDVNGTPIDPAAVVDGQKIYLDLRDSTTDGSATVTASVKGSGATGMVVTVPSSADATPTTDDHGQSVILVAASTATTDAEAEVQWAGPTLGTSLVDKLDDDRYLAQAGGTVIDTVTYSNLVPNTEYTVSGELMDQLSGDTTGISGSTVFTSSDSGSGTVDVTFTVPAGWAGHALTAFETLSRDGNEQASHRDIDDQAQTVHVADLGTTLVDKLDGDKNVTAAGGTVIDTVTYTNLRPNTEYTVTGELRDKANGDSTGIVGSTTFTSTASGSGTAEVSFVISSAWAAHTLVAFETISHGDDTVAVHQDIDDQAQTVVVDAASTSGTTTTPATTTSSGTTPSYNTTPPTTTTSPGLAATGVGNHTVPLTIAGLILLLLGSAALLVGRTRTRRSH